MSAVYTDSHAHLELVAERLGVGALADVLARYASDANAVARLGASEPAARRPACILDIGVNGGDLARRKAAVARAARKAQETQEARIIDVEPARYAERRSLDTLPLRWAAGIWPGKEALAEPDRALEALDRDLEIGVDALGECGLDYHHMDAPELDQIALFAAQVERAQSLGLPLIVHSRDAFADTLRLVAPAAARIPVVIHCFGYGPGEAEALLAAGCYISFAGNITYKKSEPLRAALSVVPRDRLLLETDSPYMNPMPRRGAPSSPLDIDRTYQFVASVLEMEAAALGEIVSKNLETALGVAPASR